MTRLELLALCGIIGVSFAAGLAFGLDAERPAQTRVVEVPSMPTMETQRDLPASFDGRPARCDLELDLDGTALVVTVLACEPVEP